MSHPTNILITLARIMLVVVVLVIAGRLIALAL